MKKTAFITLLALLLCCCHGNRDQFVLKGNVPSLGDDTLLVYGADEWFDHIDTVVARDGRFTLAFVPDTVTPLWLAFPGGHREFLFAEKGTLTTLTGDTAVAGHLTLAGGRQNDLLAAFDAVLRDTVLTLDEVQQLADSFIIKHPFDEASIYMLQRYYVRQADPSVSNVRSEMGKMSGNLQDNICIAGLRNRLEGMKSNSSSMVVLSNYRLKDPDGKVINTNNFRDTCLLVSFWASWDTLSRRELQDYRALADTFAGRPFALMSVSLDNEREAWLRAIDEDSLTWTQGNGFQGWELDMLRQLGIDRLPANVLFNAQRRTQAFNLHGDELKQKIEEVVTREEERVKAEKKAEKERQRKARKKK